MHLQTNFLSIQKQSVNVVFQLLNLTLAVFKMADNIFKIFESHLKGNWGLKFPFYIWKY